MKKAPSRLKHGITWLGLLLGVAALFQVSLVLNNYAVNWTKRVWRLRALPAEERSAIYFLGSRAAAFVDFIEAVTPEEATLVIPPSAEWLSSQSVLLYYLLPRRALPCQCEQVSDPDLLSDECTRCIRSPETYIPAIGEFPPAEALNGVKDFVPHPEDTGWYHGVYVPKGANEVATTPDPNDVYSPLRAVGIDLILVLGFIALGGALSIAILNRFSWLEFLSLAIPLGTGVWTWSVFLTSWAGIPLSVTSIAITFVVLIAIPVMIFRMFSGGKNIWTIRPDRGKTLPIWERIDLLTLVSSLVVSGLLLLSAILAVGRAYSTFDAMTIWSLKGYGMAYEQTIFAFHRLGGHGLAYPLNIPLAVSFFRLADGDVLPGSKLLFPLFTGALLLGCYRYWRRRGVQPRVAAPGLLLLLSVPIIFNHSTTGFVNLVFTAYLALGTLWTIEGLFEERPRALIMGGMLFALAGWSRAEGLGFSIIMIAALLIGWFIAGNRRLPPLYWLLPLIIIPGSWSLIGTQYIVGDEIGQVTQNFFQDLISGRADLNIIRLVFAFEIDQILRTGVWGVLFFVCSLLLLLGIRQLHPRAYPEQFTLFLATLIAVAVPIGMMVVASSTKTPFVGWLGVSMNRAMFPAVFLGTVLSVIAGSSVALKLPFKK